jgi:hypothetical protein
MVLAPLRESNWVIFDPLNRLATESYSASRRKQTFEGDPASEP